MPRQADLVPVFEALLRHLKQSETISPNNLTEHCPAPEIQKLPAPPDQRSPVASTTDESADNPPDRVSRRFRISDRQGKILRLRAMVEEASRGRNPQELCFNTAEFAAWTDRHEWTVRSYCREGRIEASRRPGRGTYGEFVISAAELLRYLQHGLRPPQRRRP